LKVFSVDFGSRFGRILEKTRPWARLGENNSENKLTVKMLPHYFVEFEGQNTRKVNKRVFPFLSKTRDRKRDRTKKHLHVTLLHVTLQVANETRNPTVTEKSKPIIINYRSKMGLAEFEGFPRQGWI